MGWILLRWIVLTVAIISASYLLEGIHVEGFFSALAAAAVLGILNAFFRPILIILTLPINILSLGLFTFVINALLLLMASGVIRGFEVYGFWSAVFGSLIISLVSWLLNTFVSGDKRMESGHYRRRREEDYIDLKETKKDRWE